LERSDNPVLNGSGRAGALIAIAYDAYTMRQIARDPARAAQIVREWKALIRQLARK
jgi:hypothetical protein